MLHLIEVLLKVIDSENDAINSDDGYTIYVNVGEKITGSKIIQAFKLGVTNCMFVPMIEWCEAKEAEASTKKTAYRYSGMKKKLIQDEKKYRDSGVSEADINFLSNKYQVNIEVNTPFQKNFIKVKSDKKALTTFKFITPELCMMSASCSPVKTNPAPPISAAN